MNFLRLPIALGDRSYDITLGAGALGHPAAWLSPHYQGRRAFIVCDENTSGLASGLSDSIGPMMASVDRIVLPSGEATKSFASYESLCETLLGHGLKRQSIIFAVGGGVIGDLAGFAAASLLRGVDFIQVPTTLLAMVDSSVGGKTGINTKHGKNLVGAFYQPRAVVIDFDCLNTLPDREMKAGYAEILKYALLGDPVFFAWLEDYGIDILNRHPSALAHAIEISCGMKASIVALDEREENGQRARLNLGHTFAHALEAAAGYDGRLLHGEAVSIGLALAADLSTHLGLLMAGEREKVRTHLASLGMMTDVRHISPRLSQGIPELLQLMQNDKKATESGLNFIVMDQIGHAYLSGGIDPAVVEKIWRESI